MLVRQGYDRSGAVGFRSVTLRRRANDVRIDCKAAKHSDGDRGTPPADLAHRTAGGVPPASADCTSAATAARANKRRFVNLLQQLGSAGEEPAGRAEFPACSLNVRPVSDA
jgi:hypothetical protein